MANNVSDQSWIAGALPSHADFASSGLDIPPAGFRSTNGGYLDRSATVYLWSSTAGGAGAWLRRLYYDYSTVYRDDRARAGGFSVRCLKD